LTGEKVVFPTPPKVAEEWREPEGGCVQGEHILCYDGVIVTCYNQVTRHGRKRKGKKIFYYFFFYL
jgi:hypothetical protein